MSEIGKIDEGFDALNAALKRLLDDYKTLSYKEIRARIQEIVKLKYVVIGELPAVCGVSFSTWYTYLSSIDKELSDASEETWSFWTDNDKVKRYIEAARRDKEALEKLFREKNPAGKDK